MDISWSGVAIVGAGLAAVVALQLWGGDSSGAISSAILAGLLGLLAPHPVRRAAQAKAEPASEDSGE